MIDGSPNFDLLLLFIPFNENGALETYLLNCIGNNDPYDKTIIDKGNTFIDTIDADSKYLTQRRLKTKAKFDVYFLVRTSAEQYPQRQHILRSVAWENYAIIRSDFQIFADLGQLHKKLNNTVQQSSQYRVVRTISFTSWIVMDLAHILLSLSQCFSIYFIRIIGNIIHVSFTTFKRRY